MLCINSVIRTPSRQSATFTVYSQTLNALYRAMNENFSWINELYLNLYVCPLVKGKNPYLFLFYFLWLTEKRTKEHNSIMFENPAFYKSLANQRYMRLTKIISLTKPNS